MNTFRPFLRAVSRPVFSLLVLGFCSAAAFAQSPQAGAPQNPQFNNAQFNNPPRNTFSNPLTARILEAERTQNAEDLLFAYGQAVTDAELARTAIAQLLTSYYTMRNGAQTAEQATQAVAEANLRFQVLQAAQNQIMVQQNQQILQQNAQIIALLQRSLRGK